MQEHLEKYGRSKRRRQGTSWLPKLRKQWKTKNTSCFSGNQNWFTNLEAKHSCPTYTSLVTRRPKMARHTTWWSWTSLESPLKTCSKNAAENLTYQLFFISQFKCSKESKWSMKRESFTEILNRTISWQVELKPQRTIFTLLISDWPNVINHLMESTFRLRMAKIWQEQPDTPLLIPILVMSNPGEIV